MRRSRSGGVTLVELLLVLALAGVLLGAAAPSFLSSLQRLRLQAAANDLVAALDLTRVQAMARGSKVLLVPLDPAGVDWRAGWQVFIDSNGNRRPDAGEPLLHQHAALPDGVLVAARFTSGGAPAYVAYNAAGRTCSAGNSLAARWGTLSLTHGAATRNIKINMLGRVRICDPAVERSGCSSVAD
jgi:type IV fimbrial biogenesis protein FimT